MFSLAATSVFVEEKNRAERKKVGEVSEENDVSSGTVGTVYT